MQKSYKKFALIGTSCVGKTTLLMELPKKLKKGKSGLSLVTVQEAARHYFEKKNVRDPFSFSSQEAVQRLAKKFEKEAEKKRPDIILCDRSVVDAVAYVWSTGDKNGAKKLMKRVVDWIHTYDTLFLLDPKGIPYKTDNVRKESLETREKFHNAFLEVLPQLTQKWVLIGGSKKQRLQTMHEVIYTAHP